MLFVCDLLCGFFALVTGFSFYGVAILVGGFFFSFWLVGADVQVATVVCGCPADPGFALIQTCFDNDGVLDCLDFFRGLAFSLCFLSSLLSGGLGSFGVNQGQLIVFHFPLDGFDGSQTEELTLAAGQLVVAVGDAAGAARTLISSLGDVFGIGEKYQQIVPLQVVLEVVEMTLESLREANYLNDERYAQNYVQAHWEDRSRLRIRMDLESRGVPSSEIISEVIRAESEERGQEAEIRQIRKLMNKRKYDPKGATWEEKGKMQAFLYRKGYSQSSVRAAMGPESLDSDEFSV